ncbi:MAG: hypothetical protein U9R74_04590 [Pseudomonadota bacterium]|nr:hypothetical protein [Pseudomonadota bacterium]
MRRRTLALLSALVLIGLPMNAQAYSVADVAGCYAVQFDGQVLLDPTTGQFVPENGLARFCSDGAGNLTGVVGYSKIAGCALVTYTLGGPSTYTVSEGGGGVISIDLKVVEARDLCQGAVQLPIVAGERAVMRQLFYLDAEGVIHTIGLDTAFPDNPVMPFLPEVSSGTAWKQ